MLEDEPLQNYTYPSDLFNQESKIVLVKAEKYVKHNELWQQPNEIF